jgi:hypothetical protein
MKTFNERFTTLSMRRRYEVWFLRLGLGDGSGAWWIRYLLMNPGRGGCVGGKQGQPAQVWATWFPRQGKPTTWIQGFPVESLRFKGTGRRECGASPFFLGIGENRIGEDECRGRIEVGGQRISWDLRYRSTFRTELSSKGWIGFSRTPHSDAVFSGEIALNDHSVRGELLGFGMQGHNCGYRHRRFWTWTHLHFPGARSPGSTFEALTYELPFGMSFRKAVLWHEGVNYTFRKFKERVRDSRQLSWNLECTDGKSAHVEVFVRGREQFVHRLRYVKTDCSGQLEVANDSLAVARMVFQRRGRAAEELSTDSGAAVEMVGG